MSDLLGIRIAAVSTYLTILHFRRNIASFLCCFYHVQLYNFMLMTVTVRCSASAVLGVRLSVWLSVCLSVTRGLCDKM